MTDAERLELALNFPWPDDTPVAVTTAIALMTAEVRRLRANEVALIRALKQNLGRMAEAGKELERLRKLVAAKDETLAVFADKASWERDFATDGDLLSSWQGPPADPAAFARQALEKR
jgi:hypothetical protein